jgi:integrase
MNMRRETTITLCPSGMRRTNPEERAAPASSATPRYARCGSPRPNRAFGALIRLLLLTAQRREKVVTMRWRDISMDGVWTIPTEEREKRNAMELVLPKLALDIIRAAAIRQ